MNRERILLRRIRGCVWIFIIGLILSGVTAIPLSQEVECLVNMTGAQRLVETPASSAPPSWAIWLMKVSSALKETISRNPFLFYGTDWLAFGHFVIAIAFVGALREPVRNGWLFTFGLFACGLVIPYGLLFGALRGIPFWWRLIDCSFGVFGSIPLWLSRKWVDELEKMGGGSQWTGKRPHNPAILLLVGVRESGDAW